MPEKLGAYSGGIRAATSQFSGAGEGGPKLIAFEADVTNNGVCLKATVGFGHVKYVAGAHKHKKHVLRHCKGAA